MKILTIVARNDLQSALHGAADDNDDVEIGTAQALDSAGDGQAFPIDPGMAIDALQAVAAAVSTFNGLSTLLKSWKQKDKDKDKDKDKGDVPGSGGSSSEVRIYDTDTGELLYSGSLQDLDPSAIVAKLDQGD